MKNNNNKTHTDWGQVIIYFIAFLVITGFMPSAFLVGIALGTIVFLCQVPGERPKAPTRQEIEQEKKRQEELERKKAEERKNSRSEIARQEILRQMEIEKQNKEHPSEELLKATKEYDDALKKLFEDAKRAKELGL